MKKSTIIKLTLIVTLIIGIMVVDGEKFGFGSRVIKCNNKMSVNNDSIQYPNLLREVTIIGKIPVK